MAARSIAQILLDDGLDFETLAKGVAQELTDDNRRVLTVADVGGANAILATFLDYGQLLAFWENAVPELVQWEPAAVAVVLANYFTRLGHHMVDDSPIEFVKERLRLDQPDALPRFATFLRHLSLQLAPPPPETDLHTGLQFFLKQVVLPWHMQPEAEAVVALWEQMQPEARGGDRSCTSGGTISTKRSKKKDEENLFLSVFSQKPSLPALCFSFSLSLPRAVLHMQSLHLPAFAREHHTVRSRVRKFGSPHFTAQRDMF
jgi:hypothetical protein